MRFKHILIHASLLFLLIALLAACSSPASPLSEGEPTTTPTDPSTLTTTASAPVAIVSTGMVPGHQSVGSTLTVLTTLQGLTLYVHRSLNVSHFDCNDTCAQKWHPLVFNSPGIPASTTPLPGTLSKGTDAEGRTIVFYQGYPLYTYVGNTAPGQNNALYADNDVWQPADVDISPENTIPSN